MNPANRRQHARYLVSPGYTPVSLRLLDTERFSLEGHAYDISEGGVQVIAQRPCPDATIVRVRFAMPLRGEIVSLDAKLRWSRNNRGLYAVGLEFVELTREARDAIAQYVSMMGEAVNRPGPQRVPAMPLAGNWR
mgnify:CR=1 FL=1